MSSNYKTHNVGVVLLQTQQALLVSQAKHEGVHAGEGGLYEYLVAAARPRHVAPHRRHDVLPLDHLLLKRFWLKKKTRIFVKIKM